MSSDVKNIEKYIRNTSFKDDKYKDIITVEHRSNNSKRDFLFVNKIQAKHIPCSPSRTLEMGSDLARLVEESLDKNTNVLIIGFAETATGIGNIVGKALKQCRYIMTTTRENVPDNVGYQLITFEEEHSHATTQRVFMWNDSPIDLSTIDYVLFVEDEISTGNTILNFINAFRNSSNTRKNALSKDIQFGVASICNWQNRKDREKFNESNIKTFSLISGELVSTSIKMGVEDKEIRPSEAVDKNPNMRYSLNTLRKLTGVFFENRLGRVKEKEFDIEEVSGTWNLSGLKSVRVIGTEECMYNAIKIAKYIEDKGLKVVCHATTRSKIDVLKESCNTHNEITSRYEISSPYDSSRQTYIYNLDEYTDMTLVVTDTMNLGAFGVFCEDLGECLKGKCDTTRYLCI